MSKKKIFKINIKNLVNDFNINKKSKPMETNKELSINQLIEEIANILPVRQTFLQDTFTIKTIRYSAYFQTEYSNENRSKVKYKYNHTEYKKSIEGLLNEILKDR